MFMKDALIPDTFSIYEFVMYAPVVDTFSNDPLIVDTLLIPIYVEPIDTFMKDALIPDTFSIYAFIMYAPVVDTFSNDPLILDTLLVPI